MNRKVFLGSLFSVLALAMFFVVSTMFAAPSQAVAGQPDCACQVCCGEGACCCETGQCSCEACECSCCATAGDAEATKCSSSGCSKCETAAS